MDEFAESGHLQNYLNQLGEQLDDYLRFEQDDAMATQAQWRAQLNQPLPQKGIGIQGVLHELGNLVILRRLKH